MVYNFSDFANQTDYTVLLVKANEYTNQLYGVYVLVLIFAAFYFKFRQREPTREAIAGAAFITLFAAALLRLLSVIDNYIMGACVVILIGAVIMLYHKE